MKTLIAMSFLAFFTGAARATEPPDLGAPIPAVKTLDHAGAPLDLAAAGASGWTLIYFYPKADTPGCTAQACSLRDDYEKISAKGVKVIGVSKDTPEAQAAFKAKYQLPFTLAADKSGEVIQAFGVSNLVGLASRSAFLFKDGKLVWRDLKGSTKKQAEDLLRALDTAATQTP